MTWVPISGTLPQYSTAGNELANDYYLKFYQSGTTTPINMATDSTGGTQLAKCALSAEGYPITNPLDDSSRFIPHIDQNYRIVLYTNETDADNNTTANAAFNIDGMVPQIAPSADGVDIALRDTTLEAQDDYDRSPLFTDGDGFTAGAGPHVITVPAGWTPTNADMRFYRVDNSGIVTVLTPTSTSSTTFTLAETLLSTDTIFIGDDEFRNLFEGDPVANFEAIKQDATTTSSGVVEEATAAEMSSATNGKFPDCETIQGLYGFESDISSAPSGNFTSGSVSFTKIGNIVHVTGSLGHSSATTALSASGFVPADYIPAISESNIYTIVSGLLHKVTIQSNGILRVDYYDNTLSLSANTSTDTISATYRIN